MTDCIDEQNHWMASKDTNSILAQLSLSGPTPRGNNISSTSRQRRSKLTSFRQRQLLYDRLLPNYQRNNSTVASNKNAKSANLDNVGQGHHLQKLLFLGYYMTDFNKTFTKMMQLVLTAKVLYQLIMKNVGQGHIS